MIVYFDYYIIFLELHPPDIATSVRIKTAHISAAGLPLILVSAPLA